LVCDKIIKFPYEKGNAKASAKPAAAKVAPGKAVAKAAPATKAAAESNGGGGDMAQEVLTKIIAANSGKELAMRKMVNDAQVQMIRGKVAPKDQKGVLDQFRDAEWLIAMAEAMETFVVDTDTNTVTVL